MEPVLVKPRKDKEEASEGPTPEAIDAVLSQCTLCKTNRAIWNLDGDPNKATVCGPCIETNLRVEQLQGSSTGESGNTSNNNDNNKTPVIEEWEQPPRVVVLEPGTLSEILPWQEIEPFLDRKPDVDMLRVEMVKVMACSMLDGQLDASEVKLVCPEAQNIWTDESEIPAMRGDRTVFYLVSTFDDVSYLSMFALFSLRLLFVSQKYDSWPLVLVQSNKSRWADMMVASGNDIDRAARSRPTLVKFEPVKFTDGKWDEPDSSVSYNNLVLNGDDNVDDPGAFKVPEVPARFKKKNGNFTNGGPKLSRTLANAAVNLCKLPYPDHATGNSTVGELANWLYSDLEHTLTFVATSYGVCSWKFYFPPPECVVVAAMSRGMPSTWLTLHDSGYTDVRTFPFQSKNPRVCHLFFFFLSVGCTQRRLGANKATPHCRRTAYHAKHAACRVEESRGPVLGCELETHC